MRFSKNIEQLIISRKHSTRDEIIKYIEQATTFSKDLEIDEILKDRLSDNFSHALKER
jgi:hypothetical protein